MAPGAAIVAAEETETDQVPMDATRNVSQVDVLLENVWPKVEKEGLNSTCLSKILEDGGDVPIEPCSQGSLHEGCTGRVDHFPQKCPGGTVGSRELARETPMDPVTSKKSFSSPPCGSNGGEGRIGIAELQSPVQIQQQTEFDSSDRDLRKQTLLKMGTIGNWKTETTDEERNANPTAQGKLNFSANYGQGRDGIVYVHYNEGEKPMADLLRLEGGQGLPVIVEAVSGTGKASRAGIVPGMELVSMNGRKEFKQLPGWQVRLLLEAPITLGFDPKPEAPRTQVGMCTEIRLKRSEKNIGVPSKVDICGPREQRMLAEQVVFQPGAAALFLSSKNSVSESSQDGRSPRQFEKVHDGKVESNQAVIYELRHRDAQVVVGRAAHGARAVVEPKLEIEYIVDSGFHGKSLRTMSPMSYCSLDFVADCVNEQHGNEDISQMRRPVKQFIYHQKGGGQAIRQQANAGTPDLKQPACVNAPKTSPRGTRNGQSSKLRKVKNSTTQQTGNTIGSTAEEADIRSNGWTSSHPSELTSPRSPRSSTIHENTCVCGPEEGDDDWLNFHNSRSPLRWLAPVLEPVVRALSPSRSPPQTMPRASQNTSCATPLSSPLSSPRSSGIQNIFAGMKSNINANGELVQGGVPSPLLLASPVLGDSFSRRGRDEAIGSIFRHSGRKDDLKGIGMQQGLNHGLGGPVQNSHSLSGPRSHSPRNQIPAGDTNDDGRPCLGPKIANPEKRPMDMPVLPLTSKKTLNEPSFSVSWNKDMIGAMQREDSANPYIPGTFPFLEATLSYSESEVSYAHTPSYTI